MTTIPYSLVAQTDEPILTLLLDGEPHTVTSAHAGFKAIRAHLTGSDIHDPAVVRRLLDMRQHVAEQMQRLSERVTFHDDSLYFDGDRLDKPMTRQIVRLIRESNGVIPSGRDTVLDGGDLAADAILPMVRFLENLALNPSRVARATLFEWLARRRFTITSDGMILGYKGVQADDLNRSVMCGREDVTVTLGNSREVHVGNIPNPVGALVEIPRGLVNPHRHVGCGVGLHVGTYDYASGWGSRLLHVLLNPRDVVVCPDDSSIQKMRVARYTVLEIAAHQVTTALSDTLPNEEDEGDTMDGRWGTWGTASDHTTEDASSDEQRDDASEPVDGAQDSADGASPADGEGGEPDQYEPVEVPNPVSSREPESSKPGWWARFTGKG